jgi:erythronate-4-phosphate dehydrogenase
VSFIGSTTAGHDHLDTKWLNQQKIKWAYAAGVNATAVAEYVLCCVADLRKQGLLAKNHCRAAVIGVGHIGSCVADHLQKIGMEVIYNDPPRAQSETDFISIPLQQLTDVDFISLHTPLSTGGEFPTFHLINHDFLRRLKPGCVLLSAGRGENVDTQALFKNNHVTTCLDVWENEPNINLELLKHVALATPHVGGYSKQAKLNATLMIYQQVLNHFQLNDVSAIQKLSPPSEKISLNITKCNSWEDVALKIYQPSADTKKMREILLPNPSQTGPLFEKLRREYFLRDEFSTIKLTPTSSSNLQLILKQLNFCY